MKKILPFFAILLLASACTKSTKTYVCKDAICTTEFRTVSLCLRTGSGAPFTPDSVRVFYPNGVLVSDTAASGIPGPACYQVASDVQRSPLGSGNDTFRFRAFRGGRIVVDTPFIIASDCCHITRISGPDSVVIR